MEKTTAHCFPPGRGLEQCASSMLLNYLLGESSVWTWTCPASKELGYLGAGETQRTLPEVRLHFQRPDNLHLGGGREDADDVVAGTIFS